IGEFSFILASVGERLGVLDDGARNAIIAAAIISITLNPVLYRLIGPLESVLQRLIKNGIPADLPTQLEHVAARAARDESGSDRSSRYKAVIVGSGPVGQTLARLLRENHIEPVIIELNVDTVRRLTSQGVVAIYGDAAHRDTLINAGVAN